LSKILDSLKFTTRKTGFRVGTGACGTVVVGAGIVEAHFFFAVVLIGVQIPPPSPPTISALTYLESIVLEFKTMA
jgi:hypothetical protein